ncbi:MAG: SDR family oxidoreductase, partial [Planctomycetes bacterium]|nr:SDR family oxidoreductase [Planctomycetota bacterium]
ALVSCGVEVCGTTTSPDRMAEISACGIEPLLLDVNDRSRVCEAVGGNDAVYLCVGAGRSRSYEDVYVPGAKSVAAAIESGDVSRVIYTSSTGVYAQDDGRWVDEESDTDPVSENGRLLLEAERILMERSTGAVAKARVSVVRLGGIYGPGRELKHFVGRAANTERSDGNAYVNMIHIEDICAAMVGLLNVDHHGVLNLTDDYPVTRREFYDTILSQLSLPAVTWTAGDGVAIGKRVCNKRIKKLLGIDLKHPAHC